MSSFGGMSIVSGDGSTNSKPLWSAEVSPTSFFHERVIEAQDRQKLKLSENVEFYIVNLLCNYIRIDEEKKSDDCLVFILQKALESSVSTERILQYKKLADTALYFAGFFQEYFNRKSFDVGYYMSMGESAYFELSSLMRKGKNTYQNTMSEVYKEMAQSFPRAVDILLDVSEHTSNSDTLRDTLSLYDAWLSSKSDKLQKDLMSRGIIPLDISKKKII
ncbi:MAG: hypothetical protein K2X39_07535 [Silvanigrellaceae bacterium]|nr:hypothetical protein [Silvanigrellaceae bacterium]